MVQRHIFSTWKSVSWFLAENVPFILLLLFILYIGLQPEETHHKKQHFENSTKLSTDSISFLNYKNGFYSELCDGQKMFAYSGDSYARDLMGTVQQYYGNNLYFKHFKEFDEMKQTLFDDLNKTDECKQFLGGLHFNTVDTDFYKLKYRILLPSHHTQNWHFDEFWASTYSNDSLFDRYYHSGLLNLQFFVETAFLELVGKPVDFSVSLQKLPAVNLGGTSYKLQLLSLFPLLLILSVLLTIIVTLNDILTAKQDRRNEKIAKKNGLKFYLPFLFCANIKFQLVFLVCAGVLSVFLQQFINPFLLVLFTSLYGLAILTFTFLLSTLIQKDFYTIVIGPLILFGLVILDFLIAPVLTNVLKCCLMSFNFYSAFKYGILNVVKAVETESTLSWANIFSNYKHSFSFGFAASMLLLDIVLMYILAICVNSIKEKNVKEEMEWLDKSVCEKLNNVVESEPKYMGESVKECMKQIKVMFACIANYFKQNSKRLKIPLLIFIILFGLILWNGRKRLLFKNNELELTPYLLDSTSIALLKTGNLLDIPSIAKQIDAQTIDLNFNSSLENTLTEQVVNKEPFTSVGFAVQNQNEITILFNDKAYHSSPLALLLLSNSLIGKEPDAIKLTIETYSLDKPNLFLASAEENYLIALSVAFIFSLLTLSYVLSLVEDNKFGLKRQLMHTDNLNVVTYWLPYVFWHSFLYLFYCIFVATIFIVFGYMKGNWLAIFIMFLLYLWAQFPFVYAISCFFESKTKSYTLLIIWNIFFVPILILIVYNLHHLSFHYPIECLFLILNPSFGLVDGLYRISIRSQSRHINSEWLHLNFLQKLSSNKEFYQSFTEVYWPMFVSGIIFWTLLLLFEYSKVGKLRKLYLFETRVGNRRKRVSLAEEEKLNIAMTYY